jgi:hypothetical protein
MHRANIIRAPLLLLGFIALLRPFPILKGSQYNRDKPFYRFGK